MVDGGRVCWEAPPFDYGILPDIFSAMNPDPSSNPSSSHSKDRPRRLRRLRVVWPHGDGAVFYLLTLCVAQRQRVLTDEGTFQRLVGFLLDSPARYGWFAQRFVAMPDHLHLIAAAGHDAVWLGEWIKALKAMVSGVRNRSKNAGDMAKAPSGSGFGDAPLVASWHWQSGFHDHKLRSAESEARKWEYLCLNPVRAGLVQRPEEWAFCGEIRYSGDEQTQFVRGTSPLLERRILLRDR